MIIGLHHNTWLQIVYFSTPILLLLPSSHVAKPYVKFQAYQQVSPDSTFFSLCPHHHRKVITTFNSIQYTFFLLSNNHSYFECCIYFKEIVNLRDTTLTHLEVIPAHSKDLLSWTKLTFMQLENNGWGRTHT